MTRDEIIATGCAKSGPSACDAPLARGRRRPPQERRRRGPPARPARDLQLLRPRLRLLRPAGGQPDAGPVPHDRRGNPGRAPARPSACGYGTVVLQAGEDYGLEAGVAGRRRPPDQGRDAAGRDPQPGRAARRRPAPCGARPGPTGTCCDSRRSNRRSTTASIRRWPAARATAWRSSGGCDSGLRDRQRRHDRHPRPDVRRPGRRHRAFRATGPGHDRRRPVPAAPRHAAGRGDAALRAPTAGRRRTPN